MPAGPSRSARRRWRRCRETPDPQSLRARFTLLYDPKAPASLIARALPDLARLGFLPPNDLASFLEHPAASVRAAALLSLNVKKSLPADLQQSVLDRLDDKDAEVREAAMMAVVPLQLRAAVPRLIAIAGDTHSPDRTARDSGPVRNARFAGRAVLSRRDPGSRSPAAAGRRVGAAGDSRRCARSTHVGACDRVH